MPELKTTEPKKKSFADEVREFFGMSVKKPKTIKSPEEGAGTLRKGKGHIPRRGLK